MHIEEFRQKFAAHPNAINVEKVKAMGDYDFDSYDFFKKPNDTLSNDTVDLIEFEGQLSDTHDAYIVLANDMLILDSVLPKHKEISYHKVDFITFPNQFYGIGIADLSLNLQGSQEILLNMAADYVYRAYNLRYFVDAESYGQLEEFLIRPDNAAIPVDLSDGRAITQKVQQQVNAPIGFDLFRLSDIFEKNVTMATNIDPQQLALMSKGKTATETVMNKEQLESMIAGVVDNFANQGLFYAGRQIWKLMQQYYSIPRVKGIMGEDDKKANEYKYRTIRLEGIKIDMNQDTKELEFKKQDGYHYFELKDEYLKTEDELDIMVRPDSLEVQSKAVKMQKMQEAFAQLMQFAANPNRPETIQMNPMALINAIKLMNSYFETLSLPKEILLTPEENEEQSIKIAEEHVMKILQGEIVPGEPGQPSSHIKYQSRVILALDAQIRELEDQIAENLEQQEKDLQKQMEDGQIVFIEEANTFVDPTTLEPIEIPDPQPPEELQEKLDNLIEVNSVLKDHNTIEALPVDALPQVAGEPNVPQQPEGQPSQPPIPGQEGIPQGGMDPMQGGGEQDMIPPQPPMPDGMSMQDVAPGFGGQPVA